jgi:uncharacterized oligopeptide transporter (OPT) family protein
VHGHTGGDQTTPMAAFTLLTTAVVFGVAAISNDNPHDHKTGPFVGSTPRE